VARIDFTPNETTTTVKSSYDPLPDGEYEARIIESQLRDNKAGTGNYLQFTWEIVGGAHGGRRVWDRITHKHKNEQAMQIGSETLSKLCRACGKPGRVDYTEELHDIPVMLALKVRSEDGYPDSNEVVAYKAAASGEGQEAPYNDDDIRF